MEAPVPSIESNGVVPENNPSQDTDKDDKALICYMCEYCDYSFASKDSYNNHVKTHEKKLMVLKYRCRYCHKRYLMPKELFVHYRRQHTQEAPFRCCVCDIFISKHIEFTKHILLVHKNMGKIRINKDLYIIYEEKKEISNCDNQSNVSINNVSVNQNIIDNEFKDNVIDEKGGMDANIDRANDSDIVNSVQHIDQVKDNTGNCDDSGTATLENNTNPLMIAEPENSDCPLIDGQKDDLDEKNSVRKSDDNDSDGNEKRGHFEFLSLEDVDRDIDKTDKSTSGDPLNRRVRKARRKTKSSKRVLPSCSFKVKKKFKCHLCGKLIHDERLFNKHVKNHFQNDKLLCPCGLKFSSVDEIAKHKKICRRKVLNPSNGSLKIKRVLGEKMKRSLKGYFEGHLEKNRRLRSTSLEKDQKNNTKKLKKRNKTAIPDTDSDDEPLITIKKKYSEEKSRKDENVIDESSVNDVSANVPLVLQTFKKVEAGAPVRVIIKKITPEEAFMKKRVQIKGTPINSLRTAEEPIQNVTFVSPSPDYGFNFGITDHFHCVNDLDGVYQPQELQVASEEVAVTQPYIAETQTFVAENYTLDEQYTQGCILVRVNPLQHLMPNVDFKPKPRRKSEYKPKVYDYASIIGKELM